MNPGLCRAGDSSCRGWFRSAHFVGIVLAAAEAVGPRASAAADRQSVALRPGCWRLRLRAVKLPAAGIQSQRGSATVGLARLFRSKLPPAVSQQLLGAGAQLRALSHFCTTAEAPAITECPQINHKAIKTRRRRRRTGRKWPCVEHRRSARARGNVWRPPANGTPVRPLVCACAACRITCPFPVKPALKAHLTRCSCCWSLCLFTAQPRPTAAAAASAPRSGSPGCQAPYWASRAIIVPRAQ